MFVVANKDSAVQETDVSEVQWDNALRTALLGANVIVRCVVVTFCGDDQPPVDLRGRLGATQWHLWQQRVDQSAHHS